MPVKECVWCGGKAGNRDALLCNECLSQMRVMLGIGRQDLEAAKATGFFRKSDLGILIDKALVGIDQLEPKSWLDKSIKARH